MPDHRLAGPTSHWYGDRCIPAHPIPNGYDPDEGTTVNPTAPTPAAEHRDLAAAHCSDTVRAELPDLHARAREHWGPPLDVAVVLRSETQRRRVRFHGSLAAASSMLACDEVDALVHAAEHGYRTCDRAARDRSRCWLPEQHRGDCCGDLWRWRLLYGQPTDDPAVTVVCSTCTPHRHEPRPADCPH